MATFRRRERERVRPMPNWVGIEVEHRHDGDVRDGRFQYPHGHTGYKTTAPRVPNTNGTHERPHPSSRFPTASIQFRCGWVDVDPSSHLGRMAKRSVSRAQIPSRRSKRRSSALLDAPRPSSAAQTSPWSANLSWGMKHGRTARPDRCVHLPVGSSRYFTQFMESCLFFFIKL